MNNSGKIQNNKTKKVCMLGLGIALFVTLSMCLRVPVFENYYLCLGYMIMAVYLYSFGVIEGTIVGVIGTLLYCILISGLRGMPGWALGNVAIGIILGLNIKGLKKIRNTIVQYIVYVIATIGSTYIGILLIKSLTEVLLYSQPLEVRIASNFTAFVADIVVLIAAMPVCRIIDKYKNKYWAERN